MTQCTDNVVNAVLNNKPIDTQPNYLMDLLSDKHNKKVIYDYFITNYRFDRKQMDVFYARIRCVTIKDIAKSFNVSVSTIKDRITEINRLLRVSHSYHWIFFIPLKTICIEMRKHYTILPEGKRII